MKIEVPNELAHLPRDPRGYPVPFGVLIDKEGKPHFKVNDQLKELETVTKKLCHVCGKPLAGEFWFIGGQLSAFHPRGLFNDGPVHKVCGTYALKVCPYLAYNRHYKNFFNVDTAAIAETGVNAIYNPTQSMKPLAFFVFAHAGKFDALFRPPGVFMFQPAQPYLELQYWLGGNPITRTEAAQILREAGEHSYLPKKP